MALFSLVSIIMPAYNAERYIEASIRSVLNQTWPHWELIVVDDCSSDRTAEIVRLFQSEDSRIRLLQNAANRGVSASRNAGIAQAKGEWVAFLDSDDCWRQDKLALQLEFAQRNHCPFTFTGSGFMDENGQPLSYCLSVPGRLTFRRLLKQNLVSCSSVLIRRELMKGFPAVSERMHEDFAAWLMILRDHQLAACGLDKPLLIYRVSRNSKSGNKLRAALMTFRVYRYIGLPFPAAVYYWGWYAGKSLMKYGKIKSEKG